MSETTLAIVATLTNGVQIVLEANVPSEPDARAARRRYERSIRAYLPRLAADLWAVDVARVSVEPLTRPATSFAGVE